MKRILSTLFCLLVSAFIVDAQLSINEFMAANSTSVYEPLNNESSDWIELYNASAAAVDLSAYFLTDNLENPDKWAFPAGTSIPGHGFLLIWADGLDTLLHCSFKLSKEGEQIGLFDPSLNIIDQLSYSLQETDISYGRQNDGTTSWFWFTQPSPGTTNNNATAYEGVTHYEPEFSIEGGFYSSPLSVELSASGGTIHYTLDGRTPKNTDPVYTTPLLIDQTSFVRARVFQPNSIPGPVITHTYFFDSTFATRQLPVVSLVSDPEYFWSSDSGIYVQSFKPEWEYPLNIEFFENDDFNWSVFNERAGVKVNGLYSWQLPQKMLGIYFRNEYGNSSLDYPVFDDRERSTYNELVLRAGGSDWSYTLFRDGLGQELPQEISPVPHQGFRPCIVFFDGQYLGIHNLRSRLDNGFIEDNYQMAEGSYDLISNDGEVEEGSLDQYNEMDAAFNADLSIQSNFDALAAIVDIENYTDYWITEIWTANTSWGHNVKLWKPKDGGKWQFMLGDLDRSFTNSNFSLSEFASPQGTSSYNYARYWMQHLFDNTAYATYFAHRFNDHIYTTFHPRRVNQFIDTFKQTIIHEVPYHAEKWAGTTSSYGNGIANFDFWADEVIDLRRFTEERHPYMMDQIQSSFGLGDYVNLSTACSPLGSGEILVDSFPVPELPWNGPYFKQMPLQLTAKASPGYTFGGWSVIHLEELIHLEEIWKYYDGGQSPGSNWQDPGFNDASWSSGQAELGYGDGDETTVVSYGSSSQNKYITTYFRKEFTYSGSQQPIGAILKIRRDDGMVVYLNGNEIIRSNLPDGSIDNQTLAINYVASDAEDALLEYFIEAPVLNANNVLAVEVHQHSGTSSDISFDLSFTVQQTSGSIISGNEVLDVTLNQDSGFMANFQPTGQCLLPQEITGNTTLSISCSPYLATGTVTIFPNVTLSVDSGVEIWFPEGASLIVNGDLQVNGTELQPVLFKANTEHGDESWDIILFDHATAISSLNYLELRNASKGQHPVYHRAAISVLFSQLNIDHLLIDNVFANPIHSINSDISINHSYLHSKVTGDLINVKYGYASIQNSEFYGNDQANTDGIDYDGVLNGNIVQSFIHDFGGFNSDGIDLGEECTNIVIENNLITTIQDKGISIGQSSISTVENNTIVNCNMGVGIKDKGQALINHVSFYSNVNALAVYEKNAGSGGGVAVLNNSILSNSSTGPLLVDSLSICTTEWNIYDTDTMAGISNQWMNPGFINPTQYDFGLKPGSGALSAASDGLDLGTLTHPYLADPQVLISDIQYFNISNPDKEFIKILNPGQDTIDLSAYSVSGAFSFIFPEGTLIQPNEKIMLVRDMNLFQFMPGQVFEWTSGQLANEGEQILLADQHGIVIDQVDYKTVSPWPVIQLENQFLTIISPDLDNHFASSWTSSVYTGEPELPLPDQAIEIYPNPGTNVLYVRSDKQLNEVQIIDLTGRVLMQINGRQQLVKLNISGFAPGMYIVRVNGDFSGKLVKE